MHVTELIHPLLARTDEPERNKDEASTLLEMLDWYRNGIIHKCVGLSDQQASRSLLPSQTTIIGIINHLALVEDSWFEVRFAGRQPMSEFANVDWDADPDYE
jgi:hypothetical protein